MPSWTRSWPAAANKACFSKQKNRPGKRVFQRSAGAVLRFSAPAAHPLHQFFRSADAGCRAPQFSGGTQHKTKTVFQSSTAGKRPPGCGSQHPFRTLSGAHVLLAAAPTAPPCVPLFVAMRHLPPAGGSLWPQAAVVAVALAELGCIAGTAAPCTRCLSNHPNARPARPCGATAGHAQSRTPVQRGNAAQNKNGSAEAEPLKVRSFG